MNTGHADTGVALRAEHLTRRFGDITAVDDLSLDVRRGEILGFLGPNGAGKTTTLRMLCGLLRPDEGQVAIDGRFVRPGSRCDPALIGVSPQAIVIWEMLTCREQLEFAARIQDMPRRAARERAAELLAVFGLEDKADRLGRSLSGGLQRRLNIALGLVHRPAILFLDEPQAGLDPQSRVLVRDYVRSLRGSTTVVVTTHDMEEAEKLADRICIVDHGRILALDTVEGVKRQAGEGDRFEIELAEGVPESLPPLLGPCLPDASLSVRGRALAFTASGASAVLPEVLRVIASRGLRLEQVRMRKTTLEDVFIHLTGRGLRE
jgi:ABC-2 type transport system ATP-binding protein